ncbi:MAG: zf-HC2 domain-containing protein [Anaerolineae bacterium]|nr:zf-HC2 domain-containing protein [Anaerolineae bacterium]
MDHILDWLQAYHDGELHGRQLQRVELHLAHCESCRAELRALQAISTLLQESPPVTNLTRPDRFVAQVELLLPLRPAQTALQRALETGWRLIPVGLFGAWVFVQAAFVVVTGILLAQNHPLLAPLFSSVLSPASDVSWLTGWQCSTRTGLEFVRCLVDYVTSLVGPIVLGFVPLLGIGLLYWGWLAGSWIRQQRRIAYVE